VYAEIHHYEERITMRSLLLGVVFAGLGAGCVLETNDSTEEILAGSNYVAMGDSYASGTGTREYYDSNCQRSNFSYAVKIANADGLHLSHVACSGARIPDVRANQLSALSASGRRRSWRRQCALPAASITMANRCSLAKPVILLSHTRCLG
jgi:hypothetical protein